MTVRRTSIEAYRDLLANGGYQTLPQKVVGTVCALHPCTRREVAASLDEQASSVSAAVNSLIHSDILTEQPNPGDRPCRVSGRLTYLLSPNKGLVQP